MPIRLSGIARRTTSASGSACVASTQLIRSSSGRRWGGLADFDVAHLARRVAQVYQHEIAVGSSFARPSKLLCGHHRGHALRITRCLQPLGDVHALDGGRRSSKSLVAGHGSVAREVSSGGDPSEIRTDFFNGYVQYFYPQDLCSAHRVVCRHPQVGVGELPCAYSFKMYSHCTNLH